MLAELSDVSEALGRNEIVPYFQSIVELRSGRLTGFEVLARWQHPIHGAILPNNFISLAEEGRLIDALTQQVFYKAFRAAASIPAPLTLSVNVSPIQLHSESLAQGIRELADAADFSLERLIIEITESALLKDLSTVQVTAGKLKDMGCRLALDDFGTGFSSLRHLQALPFDELKIDRSFVADMTRKRESRKIVAAIVGLGHSLRLATVAEGVETEEQAHMLLWLGCELGQGWRYGRAEASERLAGMVAAAQLGVIPELIAPGEEWASSNLEAVPSLRLSQLKAIYDGAPVGLCFLDCQQRYLSLNRRLAEMNGIPVEAHIGRSVKEMYPEWYPMYEPFLARALLGEAILGVEVVRPPTEARQRETVLLASYQPAWDEADEVIGISIAALDVTDLRLPRDNPQKNVTQLASVSETNPEWPWVMDAEGNDLHVSSRWVLTTPLGKDRVRNLLWLEALHPDDLERTVIAMKVALRTGTPIDVEYRIEDENGDWRWMRSTGSPRYGGTGQITRWYGSVEDIQESKMKSATV